MDLDNMSLPSFQMVTKPSAVVTATSPITMTMDLHTSTPTTSPSGQVTIASDNLTLASTIASQLSKLEANWSKILQCWDSIAAMGTKHIPSKYQGLGGLPHPFWEQGIAAMKLFLEFSNTT